MKNRLLLSLLCVIVTHATLAKAKISCDNTSVMKNQRFIPPTKPEKKPAYLPNSLSSSQHFPSLAPAPALSSTMISKEEVEPNNDILIANPLGGNDVKVKGFISPISDTDIFSFTANAGDRVYVATQTSSSTTGTSSSLEVIEINGNPIEYDDGSFGESSSSIAGAKILYTGTFYVRIRHRSNNNTILPYFLYFRLQSGTPTSEIELNNSAPTANPIPSSGWVSGNISSVADADYYSITLNAGDTIFLSLDFDPERDGTTWNGRVSFGDFGGYLTINDPSSESPNSECFFLTVSTPKTYYIAISSADGSSGTYGLSVSVLPAVTNNIFTYTNNTTTTIADNPTVTTSTISIPANKRIESLKFFMSFLHGKVADLDVRLTSPSGNTVILFTDLVNAGTASPFNVKLDDNAAIPIESFNVINDIVYQPFLKYRLEWFKGQMTQGTWTLTIHDDSPGGSGELRSWGLEIEEQLPITGTITSIYGNDFESNDGGFIHNGVKDEWERGTPTFAPITTANSGVRCWKTDLDNTYEFNTNSELVSPNIYIPNLGSEKAYFTWAQKYQFAITGNVSAYVEIQEVGTINKKRVWEWFGASMIETVGSPGTTINQSAGWGVNRIDVSEFSNKTIRIIFHFESNSSTPLLAGWAIDDVNVFKTFCPNTQNLTANYTGVFSRVVASTTITATNQITADIPTQSKANIVYQSGNSITLLPNFKADATGGATFTAQIGGCN